MKETGMRNDVKAIFSKGILCGLLTGIMLAGCSSMKWHKPQISLADVRVAGGNLLEKRLVLTLRVHNENDRDITLDGLVFSIAAGDFVVAQGARNQPVVLARMADTLVDVDASARALDLLVRLPSLVQPDGRFEYVVKGEAVIHDYGRVPFEHKDRLDMQKLLGGAAAKSSASPSAVTSSTLPPAASSPQ